MKLIDLYIRHEQTAIDVLFESIIKKFREQGKIPYFENNGLPKSDEFLELERISFPDEKIFVKRRNNNPTIWDIKFTELKDAVKLSIRSGGILKTSDYLKMYGKSNFIGTPLHLLINILDECEYESYSLVGKSIDHPKYGNCEITGISLKDNKMSLRIAEGIRDFFMIFNYDEEKFCALFNHDKQSEVH